MGDEGQDSTQSGAAGQPPSTANPWGEPATGLPVRQDLPAQQGLPAQPPRVPIESAPYSGAPQPGYPPPGYPQQPGYPPPGYVSNAWGPAPAGISALGPPGPTPGLVWGGIGVRFAAILIDFFFMLVLLVAVAMIALAVSPDYEFTNRYSAAGNALVWGWIAFFLLYQPFCWYLFSGSIGQRALGLRVVRAADGRGLGFGAVLIRYLVWAVCTGTIILGIVAAAMAADNPYKLTWPDDASKSLVIRRA